MTIRKENEFDSELEALWSAGLRKEHWGALKESICELKNKPVPQSLKQEIKLIDTTQQNLTFSRYFSFAAVPLALAILILIVAPQYSAKPVSAPLAYQIQATLAPLANSSLEFSSVDIYLSDDFELLDDDLQLMEEIL